MSTAADGSPIVHPTDHPGAAGTGCARTTNATPSGALHATIADVDGDGRRDTEWAKLLAGGTIYFGITTASGATISDAEGFAGGGSREIVIGRLADGMTVVLTSETRDSPLWTFVGCTLRQVRGVYDPRAAVGDGQFIFYDDWTGGAAGCLHGSLVGFHSRQVGKDHVTISAEHVTISRDGRRATTGSTTLVLKDAPDRTMVDFDHIRHYFGISCGASKVLYPVFRP